MYLNVPFICILAEPRGCVNEFLIIRYIYNFVVTCVPIITLFIKSCELIQLRFYLELSLIVPINCLLDICTVQCTNGTTQKTLPVRQVI